MYRYSAQLGNTCPRQSGIDVLHAQALSPRATRANRPQEALRKMERRHQHRSPTNTPTRISCELLGTICATIRNFSQNGLFVELDTSRLKPNHTVEVIADSPSYMRAVPPVKALIVRSTDKGVGLSFLEPCPRFIDTLSTL